MFSKEKDIIPTNGDEVTKILTLNDDIDREANRLSSQLNQLQYNAVSAAIDKLKEMPAQYPNKEHLGVFVRVGDTEFTVYNQGNTVHGVTVKRQSNHIYELMSDAFDDFEYADY